MLYACKDEGKWNGRVVTVVSALYDQHFVLSFYEEFASRLLVEVAVVWC